jgi:hypothetical protein
VEEGAHLELSTQFDRVLANRVFLSPFKQTAAGVQFGYLMNDLVRTVDGKQI